MATVSEALRRRPSTPGPVFGTAVLFLTSGAVQASWMSRLPALQARIDLSVGNLGVGLAALTLGTLAGMAVAGQLTLHFGGRLVLISAATATCLLTAGMAVAPTPLLFAGVLLVLGFAGGAWDAAMNIRAAAVTQEFGPHLMARFHGFWSVGTVIGAGSGVLAARATVGIGTQCAVVAGISLAAVWLSRGGRPLLDGNVPDRKPVQVTSRLLMLGSLILVGGFIEGAANDWLAVMLTTEREFSHTHAAGAYAIFVAAMTAGRFATEHLYRYIRPDWLVRGGAVLAGLGIAATVLAQGDAVFVGAALWGLGICAVFPAVVAAGGSEPGAEQVVGALTTIGYGAGLAGPLIVGASASHFQLGPTLLMSLPLVLGLVVSASSIRPR